MNLLELHVPKRFRARRSKIRRSNSFGVTCLVLSTCKSWDQTSTNQHRPRSLTQSGITIRDPWTITWKALDKNAIVLPNVQSLAWLDRQSQILPFAALWLRASRSDVLAIKAGWGLFLSSAVSNATCLKLPALLLYSLKRKKKRTWEHVPTTFVQRITPTQPLCVDVNSGIIC